MFRGPDHMAIFVPIILIRISERVARRTSLASRGFCQDTSCMTKESIQSRQNQWIKRVRKAIDRHDDEIVLEGPKMIGDAIEGGWKPLIILHDEEKPVPYPGSNAVQHSLFRELSATRSSQGVLALFPRPQISVEDLLRDGRRKLVALDSIQDPGNVGTIIRSAAAFDMTGVICLPGTADPWSSKSIRSSAGAVLAIPVAGASVAELMSIVQEHHLEVFSADPRASDESPVRARDSVVVLGSEGKGVSTELLELSRGIRIAMSPRVESLNVAAAAAVIFSRLYDPS